MILLASLFLVSCKDHREAFANTIIQKVEEYKASNKKLPKNLKELGFEDSETSPAYYQKLSDTTYEVWYGLSLGESKTYTSKNKQWK